MTHGLRAFFRRSFFSVILSAAKDLARESARHANIKNCSSLIPPQNHFRTGTKSRILIFLPGAGVTPAGEA
jgi:hypothetical protein